MCGDGGSLSVSVPEEVWTYFVFQYLLHFETPFCRMNEVEWIHSACVFCSLNIINVMQWFLGNWVLCLIRNLLLAWGCFLYCFIDCCNEFMGFNSQVQHHVTVCPQMRSQWSLNILLTFRYISFVYRGLLNFPFCCFTLSHESDRPLSKTWRLSQEMPLPVIVIKTWKTEVHESSCLLLVKIRTCRGSWTPCCTCFTLLLFLLNNFPSFSSDRFHQTTSRGAINVINYPSLVTWWFTCFL